MNLGRVLRNIGYQYKNMFGALNFHGYIMMKIVNPIFQMLFFCTIASFVYQGKVEPYIIGNALSLAYFSAFFGVGQIFIAERYQGTLSTLLCAPLNSIRVLLPKIIVLAIDAFLSVGIGFLIGVLFFGLTIPYSKLLIILLTIVICIFSALGLGFLIAAFALITRDVNMLLNVASMVLIGFSGANFSLDLLPSGLRIISSVLPLTRGIEFMRMLIGQTIWQQSIHLLIGEVILGILYFILGFVVFNWLERVARIKGSIDLY